MITAEITEVGERLYTLTLSEAPEEIHEFHTLKHAVDLVYFAYRNAPELTVVVKRKTQQ